MNLYHLSRFPEVIWQVGSTYEPNKNFLNPLTNKLSLHGERYLKDPNYNALHSPNASSAIIELAFEQIRALKYNDHPSRLSSMFAFENKQDISSIMEGVLEARVVKISAENFRLYDMRWTSIAHLMGGRTIQENALLAAERYWSGEKTNMPIMEALINSRFRVEDVEFIRWFD